MNDKLYRENQPVISKEWPECYYDVEDAAIRREMFMKHEDDQAEADILRRKLFAQRYEEKNSRYVDAYVTAIMKLRLISMESVGFFNKKKAVKLVDESLQVLCQGQALDENSYEKDIYFRELKHAVKVFIELCQRDKQYCCVLLGQGRKKDSAVILKLIRDFENMTVGIGRRLRLDGTNLQKILYLKSAMTEAFREQYPEEEQFYLYLLHMNM